MIFLEGGVLGLRNNYNKFTNKKRQPFGCLFLFVSVTKVTVKLNYNTYIYKIFKIMKTTIQIQNLKCDGCAKTILSKLSLLENISNITVNIAESSVSFISKNKENLVSVKNKLIELGYPEIDTKNSIISKAKSFVSCASGKLNN